ncbi:MAG: Dyp-type peroxidase [Pseudonocardiales bacterium]
MNRDQSVTSETVLELDDIQAGVLYPRPSPYVGTYLLFRVDERRAGQELLRRVIPVIRSASEVSAAAEASVSIVLTFQGMKKLGVPQESLDSFAPEFRQGMAARAAGLHDVGQSTPEHWEKPFGSPDVHIGILAIAADSDRLDDLLQQAMQTQDERVGISLIFRQDVSMLATKKEAFGFKDGISQPAIEGSWIAGTNTRERPLKAGEFIFGYPDEADDSPPIPTPDVLGRNGTYIVVRKIYHDVAAFRRYVHDNAQDRAEEQLLGAKMMGRWPSGAPLALSPEREDTTLGADPYRNDDFLYDSDGDARGFRTPLGSHVRRMNPRDDLDFGDVRRHRLLRRSTSYGPPLPEGVLEDDGRDRGTFFVFICASISRQFEFVQSQWVNSGIFIGAATDRDPIAGSNNGSTGEFIIPERPIRRRLKGLPGFVVTRGGEYFFMPGLRALHWLAELGN